MRRQIECRAVCAEIRNLALQAAAIPGLSEATLDIVQFRVKQPVDYMRCAEFPAVLDQLVLSAGMHVLDVGSPQWFLVLLAARYPGASFTYINLQEQEVMPLREIASALRLENLEHRVMDARAMTFDAHRFDVALSISTIEHVEPAADGDRLALKEIRRVLCPGAPFILTVPCKEKRAITYSDVVSGGQSSAGRAFYSREYDVNQFRDLAGNSGFEIRDLVYICERKGLMALDYHQWGPGKNGWTAGAIAFLKNRIEWRLGRSVEDRLARWYLRLGTEPCGRMVNICARLTAVENAI